MPGNIIEGLSERCILRRKWRMKKWFGLFALLFIFTLPALAQQTPAWDVEGAYLFRSFLPYQRSTLWNERMERLPRSQFAEMDRCRRRFHRHLSQSRRQWRLADLYLHGRSPYLFPGTSAQICSLRAGSVWRRIRSPYVSSERRIPQDHLYERRVRLGGRRRSAVETQVQLGHTPV